MSAASLLEHAYRPLIDLATDVSEQQGWTPTLLPGWCVRDLLFHLASDCQRALVALATPCTAVPDTDEVGYWTAWEPGSPGAADGLRGTRIIASAWSSVSGPAELYAGTARAVLAMAAAAEPGAPVSTQGHCLRTEDLLSTLVVEAAVHHLDLEPVLPEPPHPEVRAEARRVLDALLGRPAPAGWDDVRYLRLGTGRATATAGELDWLGDRADRLPLMG